MSDIYCYRDSFKSFDWNNSGRIGYRCLQVNKDAEKINKQTNKQTIKQTNKPMQKAMKHWRPCSIRVQLDECDTQQTNTQPTNQTNNIKPNQSAMRRAGYNPTHNEVLDIINRLIISNLVCLVYNSLYHLPLQAWRRERGWLSGHPWRPRFQGEEVFLLTNGSIFD